MRRPLALVYLKKKKFIKFLTFLSIYFGSAFIPSSHVAQKYKKKRKNVLINMTAHKKAPYIHITHFANEPFIKFI